LSNLYKSSQVVSLEDLKRLELARRFQPPPPRTGTPDENESGLEPAGILQMDVETNSRKEQILREAERQAEEIVRQAEADAQARREEARAEIEAWWQSRREEDAAWVEEARREGFEAGYHEGVQKAEEEVRREWEERLMEAKTLIDKAYRAREDLIAEGERFLVELSCAIAEKIVAKKLEDAPELAVGMVRDALARRKERGIITVCVSPDQFAFVHAAREELALVLDSQAELHILPDTAVKGGGCVVRSAFGSIDASVDTQLASIREALLQVAASAGETGDRDADGGA
jgi:flagellar assembly protein FliH